MRGLETKREGNTRMFAHYPLQGLPMEHPAHFGYVKNSYYTGMEPNEFFTICIAGRRSAMESSSGALQKSGYLANKLRRALESLVVDENRRVIDLRDNSIVSFVAGDDGYIPYNSKMVNRFPNGQVVNTTGLIDAKTEDLTLELQPLFLEHVCKHKIPLDMDCLPPKLSE